MFRFIIALCLLWAAQEANAAECGSTANRAGWSAPTERQPITKILERFIPLSLTIRTNNHRARVLRVVMATARRRLWNRGALSLTANGFATNRCKAFFGLIAFSRTIYRRIRHPVRGPGGTERRAKEILVAAHERLGRYNTKKHPLTASTARTSLSKAVRWA